MLLRLLLALITVVNFQVLTHTTAIAAAQSTQTIRGTITDRTTLQPLIGAEVLEGVDIPNPNHFARRGSSGGRHHDIQYQYASR